ncbi:MAG: beta strand repeat-containing protein, partial [Isosphaeraceae bacterium]
MTLSKPATATGVSNLTIGTGSSINADGVFINARYVDINEPINVGRSGNESLSLPASLDNIIAQDQSNYANGILSTTAGDAPGYYTLPSTTVSGGDTPITAQYDALTGQIVVSQVSAASGGFISLDGAIMSTSTFGEINVSSGLGQVTVDNQTSYPIVISDVSASKSSGSTSLSGVDIIDTNQPAATEQTLYVYQPGNIINEYQGTAGQTEQQLQQGSPAAVIQGNSTSYTPEAGLRWEWQLQTTMQQPNLSPGSSSSAGWGFDLTDVNGLTANNPWYFLTTPNGGVYDGTSQPTGWAVVDPGLPAFQETISGAVTNSTPFTIFYHNGDYGFQQTNPPQSDSSGTIDPWTYLYALQAELTLTESVKADNPFGIDFSGPSQASINITSDTPVILGGNIANAAGSTTISAPSITQSPSATLTSDNLTLTSTGGVGTSAQPLDVSLTSGGMLNVQAGSQGAYLNLGSGALIGQVAAGNATSGYGNVVLGAIDGLGAAPGLPSGTVNVTGANVTLSSSEGAIGSSAAPLTIQAQGTASATALGDIDLIQPSGDLHVGQIASSSGNVYLDVPSGSIVDGTGTTWLSVVDSTQSQQIWSNLSLTNPTAAENQAVTTFENTVDANYAEYWGLLDNSSVQGGVFTLNLQAVALYTGEATAALNVANPTAAQVQAYAGSQYQSLVNFFAQTLSPDWLTLPEFQAYDPSFQSVATAQQVANLESNAGWTTSELMNPVADVAVDPQAGTLVGLTIPNISGVNVTLVTGGSIGQSAASITIPLADIQSGNLTAAQQQALADATAPGDIRITSAGVVVSPAAQVLISATGALTATSGGSLTVQSTAPDITVNQVTAGGPVSITAPESILSTGSGTQITSSGSTTLKAGTGTLGTTTSPLTVKSGGPLYPYAPPGNSHLQVNGLSAIPVALNAVEGQPLSSAVGSPPVVANFADYAANGNVAEFTATINWGDGTPGTTGIITYNATTQQFAVESSTDHVYITTDNYTVTVTIQDTLYSTSVVADSTAAIQVAELELDPSTPGGLMLAIGGTTGSDNIVVGPGAALGQTMVTVNGSVLGPFSPTTRTVIFGQGGNDHYEVDAPLSVPVFVNANNTGANSLTVVGDGATDAFTVSSNSITVASSLSSNAPQPITFQNVQSLTIDGGSGTDLVAIDDTAPSPSTTVNTGTGSDTVSIEATSSPLVVNAQMGTATINVQSIDAPASINTGISNDAINVSSTAPAPGGVLSGIAATLTIDGGAGNTLNISDAGNSSASTSTLTATTFGSSTFAPGGSVAYTGLGALNIAMGSGGNVFTVAGTAPGTMTTIAS